MRIAVGVYTECMGEYILDSLSASELERLKKMMRFQNVL